MNNTTHLVVADKGIELTNIAYIVEILKDLMYDLKGRYFECLKPDDYFEYEYPNMQTQINACCFIAQSAVDMLVKIEECILAEEVTNEKEQTQK